MLLAHAFVGWALCFATMGVGQAVTSLQTALVLHAVAAPLYFCGLSFAYFRRFAYTTPLQTAVAFTSFVVVVDLFLVALVILRSLAMFASPLGTWIPFALIFCSTWATGRLVTGRPAAARPHQAA
ncbi:MAG TPA: hypothetical protein VOB72_04885 [Candidatus Dormibacteraeota bacterium]|nr:hypothetical protein [Candidatus Dormibacteraeota bacterium]